MTETFALDVVHNNKTKVYEAEISFTGYTHKIMVVVDEQEIIFEPDEERNYRAVIAENSEKKNLPDTDWLQAIANEIELAFK